jgi:RimJ/RimL family protein N-acetyltransferase
VIRIGFSEVTPQLAALFDPRAPASLRCRSVLTGADPGAILTDDADRPSWGAVWESGDGMLFLGGTLDPARVHAVIAALRQEGEVLAGFWDGDQIVNLLPTSPDWVGSSLEFYDRPAEKDALEVYLRRLPGGHTLRQLDAALLERCLWYEDTVRRHSSAEAFLEHGMGACLMRGDEILSEAYAGKAIAGVRELGAITAQPYRGRGYATMTCAYLILACEREEYSTYWNCATSNAPSVAIARKMGYRTEREFQWWGWSQCVEWVDSPAATDYNP